MVDCSMLILFYLWVVVVFKIVYFIFSELGYVFLYLFFVLVKFVLNEY